MKKSEAKEVTAKEQGRVLSPKVKKLKNDLDKALKVVTDLIKKSNKAKNHCGIVYSCVVDGGEFSTVNTGSTGNAGSIVHAYETIEKTKQKLIAEEPMAAVMLGGLGNAPTGLKSLMDMLEGKKR